MKKVIRLTERDLIRLVKKVIKESELDLDLSGYYEDDDAKNLENSIRSQYDKHDEKVINSVKWYLTDVEGANLRGDETDDELINMYTNLRYNRK
jgi:hypothetical protein